VRQWTFACRRGVGGFSALEMLSLSIALFAVLVALATGLGRMYYVNTADEDRYQTIVALYWLGLLLLLLSQSARDDALHLRFGRWRSVRWGVTVALLLFWTGCVLPVAALRDARAQLDFFDRVNTANLAIATGQWDFQEIRSTLILGDKLKRINRVEQHAGFLREREWGIFAQFPARLLGRELPEAADADSCPGGIDGVAAVAAPYRGFRINGEVDGGPNAWRQLWIVTESGRRVVGMARVERRADGLWPWGHPAQSSYWTGYTVNLPAAVRVLVLGERRDGRYCQIGSSVLLGSPQNPA